MALDVGCRKQLFKCVNHIEKYKCPTCSNYQTNSLVSLNCHIRDGHSSKPTAEDVYNCLKCSFVTYSKFLIVQHSYFCENSIRNEDEMEEETVTLCSTKIKTNRLTSNFEKHVLFGCEHCPAIFKSKEILKKHNASCGNKPQRTRWLRCHHCPRKFENMSGLKQHITSHSNPDYIPWFQREVSCNFEPNENFPCRLEPNDIPWLQCTHCGYKSRQKENLTSHINVFHSKPEDIQWFKCEQCAAKYKNKGSLIKHLKLAHSKPKDIQQCSTKFKTKINSKSLLERLLTEPTICHSKSDTPSLKLTLTNDVNVAQDEPKVEESPNSNSNWFECAECPYRTQFKNRLSRHSLFCRPISLFNCQHCPNVYTDQSSLTLHVTVSHSKPEDIQWFQCEQCPYKCPRKGTLRQHIKSIHSKPEDIKWFQCEKCSYQSKRKCSLSLHRRTRHTKPEDIQWLQCEQCSAKFKQKSELKQHKASHSKRKKDIQWFRCEHCSLRFILQSMLDHHLKVSRCSVFDS